MNLCTWGENVTEPVDPVTVVVFLYLPYRGRWGKYEIKMIILVFSFVTKHKIPRMIQRCQSNPDV